MNCRYWYNAETGQIKRRTLAAGEKKFDMPYFDSEERFNWSNYRVDIATGELVLIDNPHPDNPRNTDIPKILNAEQLREI